MTGDIQDVCCTKCGKYLFTEKDTENGYRRENDNENYVYDDVKDEFICEKCRQKFSFILVMEDNMEEKTLEEKIEFIKKMQQNTADDTYDNGFYNGIEYCLSVLEDREAEYKPFRKQ